jgi:hypothetical protein
LTRPQKITFAEARASSVRGVLIYCSGYRCSHCDRRRSTAGDVRLFDLEQRFVCKACGCRRADVRPE